jgi:hypothetical protein
VCTVTAPGIAIDGGTGQLSYQCVARPPSCDLAATCECIVAALNRSGRCMPAFCKVDGIGDVTIECVAI